MSQMIGPCRVEKVGVVSGRESEVWFGSVEDPVAKSMNSHSALRIHCLGAVARDHIPEITKLCFAQTEAE